MPRILELAIVGGGLGCIEVMDLVDQINAHTARNIVITSVLDDSPEISQSWRTKGFNSLGLTDWNKLPESTQFVYAVGTHRTRLQRRLLLNKLGVPLSRFATLKHPSAQVSSDAKIGTGAIIHGNVVLYPMSSIGIHAVLSAGCIIGVNTRIGDYSLLAANVTTASNVVVDECVMLGTGVTIGPDIHMFEGSMAAVGSVVLRDVPAFFQVIGNPAKIYARTLAE